MKQYIINNFEPFITGVCAGLIVSISLNTIENIITKIAIILKQ